MGTRIHVYLSHDLPRFDDTSETISRLNSVLGVAIAVRDYWRSVDPSECELDSWQAERVNPELPKFRRYSGPGSLRLTVTPAAAKIGTGGRWRGFLSIEPLRSVHIAAFRAIARVMGSAMMAVCDDGRDDVSDVFMENGSQQQCIAQMHAAMGAPQASLDAIAPEIATQAKRGVPSVWFLDGPRDAAMWTL